MKYYDISLPVQHGMPIWPGDDKPFIEPFLRIEAGDVTNSTRIQCSLHTGTHIDAPRHLFNAGKGIEEISLDTLIGPAAVIAMGDVEQIGRTELEKVDWPELPRVLFKTRNSDLWKNPLHHFQQSFVSLTADGAAFLLEKGVKLVGIDYFSIDLYAAADLPVHKLLLKAEMVIVEGLNLRAVPPGNYELYCLPVKVAGADGAMARAVLKA